MTRFLHSNLGFIQQGSTVVVTLTRGANVRLMDASNLQSYRSGRQHRYYGGFVTKSPYRIAVPHAGMWHLTVDVVGLRDGTQAGVRVEPPRVPLPPAPEPIPHVDSLAEIRQQPISKPDSEERQWDAFVSYASEDKEAVARPLAESLQESGLTVWFDDAELRIGDSLRRKIDEGLARSRFGIVVLSETFFSKGWPQYELDGMITRSVSGEQSVLPILHDLSRDQLRKHSPSLADMIARSTSDRTVLEIAQEINEVISVRSTLPRERSG